VDYVEQRTLNKKASRASARSNNTMKQKGQKLVYLPYIVKNNEPMDLESNYFMSKANLNKDLESA